MNKKPHKFEGKCLKTSANFNSFNHICTPVERKSIFFSERFKPIKKIYIYETRFFKKSNDEIRQHFKTDVYYSLMNKFQAFNANY